MLKNKDDFVNVSLRIRPVISQDSTASSCLQIISTQPPVLFILDRPQTYNFDNIFGDDIDQESVFSDTVKPLVNYVKNGYNCTIFAYGQTGTGKTYTMGTNPHVKNSKDKGLIPRTLEEFFDNFNDGIEPSISVSFIEIYNEKVFDLLRPNSKDPLPVKGFHVPGVSTESVYSSSDAKMLLEFGNKNRHTAETKQNSNSSRSHAIFTIICTIRNSESVITAKLNLVDLAGSESVKKTGNQGNTFTEGININKGLLSIGQVVKALTTDATFVPYRQSIITSILRDSLNKNNFISLIACVNSNPEDLTETIQTLNFASEVKKMKNRPEVNELLAQYKQSNPNLFRGVANTPFKRPTTTPFKTPFLKKIKNSIVPSLNIVSQTPLSSQNHISEPQNDLSSPKSLFSASISSITSQNNVVQPSWSPVIKKYISQMESTLMSKIESVIRETIQRPSRKQVPRGKENKNEHNLSNWDEIKKDVSELVQEEMSLLAVKSPKATSSPIEDQEEQHVRRTLKYDTSDTKENISHDNFEFKKPAIVKKLKKKSVKPIMVSPIEVDEKVQNKTVRRSKRISVRKDLSYYQDKPITTVRKSTRLSIKRTMDVTINNSVYNNSLKTKETPLTNTPLERVKKQGQINDSPHTSHRKTVLHVINNGSVNEIGKLHTVGIKTAEQIILFRKLKGGFKSIDDLSSIPGWGVKKYKRFTSSNCLEP